METRFPDKRKEALMKQLFLFFLKPLSFLPALLMMYAIFQFSAQTGDVSGNLSYEVSYQIIEIGNDVFHKGLEEWQISEYAFEIEYPVRKLAHMSEYFLLAVALSFPFYVYGLRGFPLMLVAGFICVAFAFSDEYHQSFVAGRGPSLKDVGIDSIGAFFGIVTVRIICWLFLTPARVVGHQQTFARRKLEARRRAQRQRSKRRNLR